LVTILPFLSRTVTGKVTTFTSTESVVVGVELAGGVVGVEGVEFWDWSAGARRSSSEENRKRPMPTLDERNPGLDHRDLLVCSEA
jgi:hypothetical protein